MMMLMCGVRDRVCIGIVPVGGDLTRDQPRKSDDVHNVLLLVSHADVLEAKLVHVLLQFQDMGPRVHLKDEVFRGTLIGHDLGGYGGVHGDQVQLGCRTTRFVNMRPLNGWDDVIALTRWWSMYRMMDPPAVKT